MNLATVIGAGLLALSACGSAPAQMPAVKMVPLAAVAEDAEDVAWAQATAKVMQFTDLRVRIALTQPRIVERDGKWVTDDDNVLAMLVDQARGSTDPLTLHLLVRRCRTRQQAAGVCNSADFVKRWIDADTQNQVAWLTLAAIQRESGDLTAARATFERAAQASVWRDQYRQLAQSVVTSLQPMVPSRGELRLIQSAFGISSLVLPFDAYQLINFECKDPTLRSSCIKILDTVFRDSETLSGLGFAAMAAKYRDLPPDSAQSRQQHYEAVTWGVMIALKEPNRIIDEPESADAVGIANARKVLLKSLDLGERTIGLQALAQAHLSEAEAAKLLRDDREALQKTLRTK